MFITRDGYMSGVMIDATPDSITMAIRSLDIARHGQELTFVRKSPNLAVTSLYEEEAESLA